MIKRTAPWFCLIAISSATNPAIAQSTPQPSTVLIAQPGMNLGDTSFLDGGGTPGLTLELLGSASTADGQDTGVFSIHPLYTTNMKLFGGNLGFDVLMPTAIVGVDLPGAQSHRETVYGVGDVSVGTFLQWLDVQLAGRPLWVRAALSITTATGDYRADRAVNLGNNVWQITPYLAGTWQPTSAWEISARVTYDWASRNNNPNTGALSSAQAGDQLGINLATSYMVWPKVRLGVSGFAYSQLRDARSDNVAIPGSRQRLFGVGPGLLWNASEKSMVLFNAYREFGAENRVEGYSMRLRLLQSF